MSLIRMLRHLNLFVVALLLIAFSGSSFAQIAPTAERGSTLAVFGTYKHLLPDYGTASDNGGSFGVDYEPFLHLPLLPKIEGRATFASGSTVNENTYLFGPRVGVHFARFHPYADALIGYGTIHYNFVVDPLHPGYRDDSSVVYSLGGGMDVDLKGGLQAKADWQYELWNLGDNATLSPSGYSLGLAYRFGNRNARHPVPRIDKH